MSYLDYHSCLEVLCTPSFFPAVLWSSVCYVVLQSQKTLILCLLITRSFYLLWNHFLQANSNWEHLYFLKQWIKRRQSTLLLSTPLFEGNSVASPKSQVIAVPPALLGFARLVCQGGSTELPASIYLARYSSGKDCSGFHAPCRL